MKTIYKITQAERLNQTFKEAKEHILNVHSEVALKKNLIAVLESPADNPQKLYFRIYNTKTKKMKSHHSLNDFERNEVLKNRHYKLYKDILLTIIN